MPKKTKKEIELPVSGRRVPAAAKEVHKGVDVGEAPKPLIGEITESFGNGEMNVLRNKINEIIQRIS